MNIAQAKQIPIKILVEQLGGRFSHKGSGSDLWYFSPFRPDEHTASFKVDEKTNKWHDFARTNKVDAHGDIIDLWTDYHCLPRREGDSIRQALKAIKEEFGDKSALPSNQKEIAKTPRIVSNQPRYKLLKQPCKIWVDSLKTEVARRKLSLSLIDPYIKQGHIEDAKTKKRYYGFVFPNDKGGYEVSIPNPFKEQSFKTVIGRKAITSIINSSQTTVCVFEGFWDYLAWLAMGVKSEMPTIYVLNSVSLIYELANKLIASKNSITSIFLFLDNDSAGLKAQTLLLDLLEPHNLKVGTSNHVYQGYKDLSEYWVSAGRATSVSVRRTPDAIEDKIGIYKV